MDDADDAATTDRSMTCGRGTARDVARALVRARLLKPVPVAMLLLAAGEAVARLRAAGIA